MGQMLFTNVCNFCHGHQDDMEQVACYHCIEEQKELFARATETHYNNMWDAEEPDMSVLEEMWASQETMEFYKS